MCQDTYSKEATIQMFIDTVNRFNETEIKLERAYNRELAAGKSEFLLNAMEAMFDVLEIDYERLVNLGTTLGVSTEDIRKPESMMRA